MQVFLFKLNYNIVFQERGWNLPLPGHRKLKATGLHRVKHKVFLLILIITRTNGDMSHFSRVGIFNSGLCMKDAGL